VRAPGIKKRRRPVRSAIAARLNRHVTLEARADGKIAACFDGYSVSLGTFSAGAAHRAQDLRQGLPLASLASGKRDTGKEVDLLVRRLAKHGLLEYRIPGGKKDRDLVVIEPQLADYWPQAPQLGDTDIIVLSRFAYLRRRGSELVLESPRANALFRICDPEIASTIAVLATPQSVKQLRRQKGFPGLELLALLVDCRILFKIDAAGGAGLRPDEGDANLVLWDFHDLLFHARSTEGRHANPLGGVYPYVDGIRPLPAVRPRWPGKKLDLAELAAAPATTISPLVKLLRDRHSTREFDDQRPITLAELARFLDSAARVLSTSSIPVDAGEGPTVEYAMRPYPSAGAEYALELYLTVDKCEGLARGFYHYDAGEHALMPISTPTPELDALLAGAEFAMGAATAPQILITIAARFGRVSWKYSSLAYALILKDVGVLMQTFYLTATAMELGGCAIGIVNIDLFAKLTGIEFHVEGPVGQFALGRAVKSQASD
jgi:SagB-type dehydrogenase family enzyme